MTIDEVRHCRIRFVSLSVHDGHADSEESIVDEARKH